MCFVVYILFCVNVHGLIYLRSGGSGSNVIVCSTFTSCVQNKVAKIKYIHVLEISLQLLELPEQSCFLKYAQLQHCTTHRWINITMTTHSK